MVFGGITVFVPCDGVVFGEIPFGMAVGSGFGPIDIMVALAEGAHQAGQPDDGKISPTETLAVGGVPELVHAELVANDEACPIAAHPPPRPKVNEGAERHAHAVCAVRLGGEGDAAQGVHPVDLPEERAQQGVEPSHEGLGQLPGEPREQLPNLAPNGPVRIGQEQASADFHGVADVIE